MIGKLTKKLNRLTISSIWKNIMTKLTDYKYQISNFAFEKVKRIVFK